uniref:Uncharacterized protein n=1 Tax=Nelumbo nucifera TaxID=4432 RepID=A0A822YWD9_NELNU|nr:TPA_asm: hypothetical protein HUJ06_006095 [Nelumbo nucifera]
MRNQGKIRLERKVEGGTTGNHRHGRPWEEKHSRRREREREKMNLSRSLTRLCFPRLPSQKLPAAPSPSPCSLLRGALFLLLHPPSSAHLLT